MTLLIGVAIIAVVAIVWISVYNGLVKSRMQTKEAWSQIDVQLKRTNVSSAQGPAATMAASDQLSNALTHLFAVAEAYPDLKASANFTKLQEELTNTENKIAYSRQLFNTTTASYNTKLQAFPSNIIAGIHHFEPSEFIAVPESEKEVPTVKF